MKELKQPDFLGSMYNKRNGYATVYDQNFYPLKSPSGRTLSNAGNILMNANTSTYQEIEAQRRSPFGELSGPGILGAKNSSSVYGGFFKK